MCGITGIYTRDEEPVSPIALREMTDAIAHRGPDGEGIYIDGGLGLGHRRLAIIDPTPAGHQPMATPDRRFVLSYNGEVYNYQELRVELEALGHRFRSRTDTEVVLNALVEWGERALERFNGMFALALWDERERELLVARDRYGIKPLYHHTTADGTFVFGSEIKALIAYPKMEPSANPRALVEYLTFQNLFTDQTLFRGVHLLPPGSWMRLRSGGRAEGPKRYWDFSFREPDERTDPAEQLEELDRLFQQAVNRHLVADVPVGSYLSGGMDSGSITAVAARQIPNLRTFTVGFDLHSASGMELAFDEREKAEQLSYRFSTEHYEMVLKAGDMERVMPRLIRHLEDPRVGQCYPNFYAAQLAAKFGKVVLSGAGGDELFAGYPWRYYRAVVNDDFEHYVAKYNDYWQRLVTDDERRRLLAPLADEVADVDTDAIFRGVFTGPVERLTSPEDYINHSLYFEAKTFLHGLLLVEDKLSMASSLETRLPFLDNDLCDFAQTLPVGLKLGNLGEVVRLNENEPGPKTQRFFNRSKDGKLILRKMMERYVPSEVTAREKQGFSGPDASWFRGESIEYVRRTLLAEDARIHEFLDRDAVRSLVGEHLDGRRNHRLLIWSLLCVEEWCASFLSWRRAGALSNRTH